MKSGANRRAILLAALVGFVVGVGICVRFDLLAPGAAVSLFGGDGGSASNPPIVSIPDFADLAEHVSPAVVNISTTQEVKGNQHPFGPGGPGPNHAPETKFPRPPAADTSV